MKIITLRQILLLHELEIERHDGSSGLRDVGMLQSEIGRPFATFGGNDLYPDIFIKAATLIQSIVKNHPFLDGNKRTAFVSAVSFLEINGYDFSIASKKAVAYLIRVANENLTVDQISSWLKKHSKPL